MFTLAVLDSEAFCCKGIADYFEARDIRTFCCPDMTELEFTLDIHSVQVAIAELATSRVQPAGNNGPRKHQQTDSADCFAQQ